MLLAAPQNDGIETDCTLSPINTFAFHHVGVSVLVQCSQCLFCELLGADLPLFLSPYWRCGLPARVSSDGHCSARIGWTSFAEPADAAG